MADELDHLRADGFTEPRDFKSTLIVVKQAPPTRNRLPHGQKLLDEIARLRVREQELIQLRRQADLPVDRGMAIAIEFTPKGIFDSANLEWTRDGIEVLATTTNDHADVVVVHVPDGKLAAFESRVRAYLEETTKKGNPKNATLVNAIESFRRAAFDELWTSEGAIPDEQQVQWFQLWLRAGTSHPKVVHADFLQAAARLGIDVETGFVPFPGRVVIAVKASRAVLQQAIELLDTVAEIRSVDPTAEFFLSDLTPAEQSEWIQDLVARTTFGSATDAPYVTLLDTGVAHAHPLIRPNLAANDAQSVDSSWPAHDHHGHGTQMAGVILHGNLTEALSSATPREVNHHLESVNIYPPNGENHPHLYGWITERATELAEAANLGRRRTFVMMSTSTGICTGKPSEWSATIDRLAFGGSGTLEQPQEESNKRLYVLSCGNVAWNQWKDYPDVNSLATCENPSQAWNALAVAAHTELVEIDKTKWPHLEVIAATGQLSPCSTTSLLWAKNWPSRPDVVAEGGNGSRDSMGEVVGPESIRLLTTCKDMSTALLTETGDTSAAAAQVARLCAQVADRYPEYWPETIRAVVVHGATYTPAMRAWLPDGAGAEAKRALLARVGYGAININRTLNSDYGRPNIVLQEKITPYRLEKGDVKLATINMHQLPWPAEALIALGGAIVEMRVTLSYFIEPNPSQRGWQSKFRYQSHGLRFAVKAASESENEFGQRINKIDREEAALSGAAVDSMPDPDSQSWLLGRNMRSRGSLHSDVWKGTATDLASKSHVAVFPVGGWWKDWKGANRSTEDVRYALVVSLEIGGDIDVDFYTPISAQITVPIEVTIPS